MRILIDVNHPAHVHLFRNAAKDWLTAGEAVLLTATDKDVTVSLLDAYDLPHDVLYKRQSGKLNLAKELVVRTFKLVQLSLRFQPDIFLSVGSPTAAFASTILRKPHVSFEDTEDSLGQITLYKPFTTKICVPDCFMVDLGNKMIPYAGYHELNYLHPNRFLPDPAKLHPLTTRDTFFVVRFVSWDASHDGGEHGFSEAGKQQLLKLLHQHGQVVVSVEQAPPRLLNPDGSWGHEFGADTMHHLLAFAKAYIGEGVTAASEAAVLGTPSILVNTRTVGYIKEQQETYNLTYLFSDDQAALTKLQNMLKQSDLNNVWRIRQERLLHEKIDVTAWMQIFVKDLLNT